MRVDEPYSKRPRLDGRFVTVEATVDDAEVVDGRVYLDDRLLTDGDVLPVPDAGLWLDGVDVRSTTLGRGRRHLISATRTRFGNCDLSGERFGDLNQVEVLGCKLQGASMTDAVVVDAVFERCVLRMASFRMARFERVEFRDCELTDVDGFELSATDVSFDGCRLERFSVDRMAARRVDLRGVRSFSLEAAARLDGCLVSEQQLPAIAFELAAAVGLSVELIDPVGDN